MNYDLWKKPAQGEPVFLGYSRATNFTEAVANKFGVQNLDRNEDQSIKMVDGFPSLNGEVIYPSKEDALGETAGPGSDQSENAGSIGDSGNSGDGNGTDTNIISEGKPECADETTKKEPVTEEQGPAFQQSDILASNNSDKLDETLGNGPGSQTISANDSIQPESNEKSEQ